MNILDRIFTLPHSAVASFCLLILTVSASAAEDDTQSDTVRRLAKQARDSVVVISTSDRKGDEGGLGTGFAIERDLIVTNLHVIGQSLPFRVETREGKELEVKEIFASDAAMDLAIIRVEGDLPSLKLAKDELEVGQLVVGVGHPLGFKDSVVHGLVAGEESFRGTTLWQLGMTIEPGISGSPLLDSEGRVHGIISMKSAQKEAFGFAVKVKHLETLLAKPNPISFEKWQTFGRLHPLHWESPMGAQWRRRGGKLSVSGEGNGFGGRALLLRKGELPELPFELAVSVKLDDEAGAAGLVFHSDKENKHYGFYPSNGRIRLTSFDGPSVFNWDIVEEIDTEHYRAGEWNELKVRVEKGSIVGFVNGKEIVRVDEVRQPLGVVGLCSFRKTSAEFKSFRVDKPLPQQTMVAIEEQLNALRHRSKLLDIDLIGQTSHVLPRLAVLESKALALEQQAKQLRKLGQDIHTASVCSELAELGNVEDDQDVDLLRGALLISKLDNPELDVDAYIQLIDGMAKDVQQQLADDASEQEKLRKLDDYLFKQNGFHGSRNYYYSELSSYVDRVLEDREGIPVTLSVVYISLAKRLGLNVVGVGLPSHFIVRHEVGGKDNVDGHELIDVFNRGERISKRQASSIVLNNTGALPGKEAFATSSNRSILVRMLVNLVNLSSKKPEQLLRYLEGLVALQPDSAQWRGPRGVLRHRNGRTSAGIDDIDWILEKKPKGVDLEEVRRMREVFARQAEKE